MTVVLCSDPDAAAVAKREGAPVSHTFPIILEREEAPETLTCSRCGLVFELSPLLKTKRVYIARHEK